MVALNIKNPETVALAKRLADRTGESVTTAVTEALRERLKRVEGLTPEERRRQIREVTAVTAPILGEVWSTDKMDDLLYDEAGLPK